jgi:hypothetical protein
MKNFLSLFLIIFAVEPGVLAQVCTDQGTSTNLDDPNAPTAPENDPDLWLNSFNWYANDGYTLFDFAIHDVFTSNPNQTTITNPYSNDNGLYSHLTNVPVELRDMRPEERWELLSVNLGAYPNCKLLANNFEESPFA